jgi:hypothetical protein
VRSRHRRAAQTDVCVIGRVIAGASACAWGGNIGLDPVTPIDCYGSAAAKVSNIILTRNQRDDRVGRRVDGRRIHHRRTVGTVVASACHHHNAGSSLGFYCSLQRISRTTFRRRANPRVTRDIWSSERVSLPATYWIRCQEPFHALDVPGRCAVTLIHVTTTNPLPTGRHSDLIAHPVVPNRSAYGMRAMAIVIARER